MDRGAWWAIQSMGLQNVGHNWATNFHFFSLSFLYVCIYVCMTICLYVFLPDQGRPKCLSGKESACQWRRPDIRQEFDPWLGKLPWRRKWQPTPALFLGKSHGQRSLEDCRHGVAKSWTRLSDWAYTHN